MSLLLARKKRSKKNPTKKPPSLARLTDLYATTPIDQWTALDTETTGLSIPHGTRPFLVSAWALDDASFPYTLANDNPFAEYDDDLPGSGGLWWGEVEWTDRSVEWSPAMLDDLAHALSGRNLVGYNLGFDLRMLASIGIVLHSKPLKYEVNLPPQYYGPTPPPRETRVVEVNLLADLQIGVHVFDNRGPTDLDQVTKYYCGLVNADDKRLGEETRELRKRLKKEPGGETIAFGREIGGKDAPKSDYWMLFQDAPSPDPSENLCSEYALRDVFRTLYGWDYALEAIADDDLHDQLARQMRAFPAFVQLPTQGVPVHEENLNRQIVEWEKKWESLGKKVRRVLKQYGNEKPNAGSPDQIRNLLYLGFKLPILKKTTSQLGSADKDTIAALLQEDIKQEHRDFLLLYQEYKATEKTHSTLESYRRRIVRYEGFPYLFGDFKQTGTALTRCSADNPNLQNIPKRTNSLRNIIGCPPGWKLVSIDYSQVEIRLFVRASGDPEMRRAIESGLDIHTFTASEVFNIPYDDIDPKGKERSGCKGVNFGILYGAGESKIIRTIGNANGWKMYQEKFPNVSKYMNKMKAVAKRDGEVRTLFGYRIWIAPEPLHVAVNCVVQGSAGDAAKEAMVKIHYADLPVRVISQVHDELLFLIPDNAQVDWVNIAYRLQQYMESVGDMIDCELPADAEYHPEHWGEGQALPSLN